MALPDHVRLIVLFGGQSAEHDVSCVSARHVLAAIDPERYDALPVGITPEGQWVRADDAIAALERGAASLPPSLTAAGTEIEPLPTVHPAQSDMPIVVLPLLHGTRGEDGTVQGLLELAGVPFVGTGVLGSALCMDKLKAKDVAAANGIPQLRWIGVRDTELDDPALPARIHALGWPVFVKPANLGSSVGISKVAGPDALAAALTLAASYDEWVVIEEAAHGREIEVAVLGNAHPRASVPGEIVPGGEFYDYDDKYLDDAADLIVPADLPPGVADEVRALAVRAFTVLRCEGMARVDFFYEEEGRGLLFNEANTIPGFTPVSMYPKLWDASGLPYPELIDELVRLALERHEHRARLSTKR
jgi:D-alanine-D-alanine ligase